MEIRQLDKPESISTPDNSVMSYAMVTASTIYNYLFPALEEAEESSE